MGDDLFRIRTKPRRKPTFPIHASKMTEARFMWEENSWRVPEHSQTEGGWTRYHDEDISTSLGSRNGLENNYVEILVEQICYVG
jgi:hypothetical protein